LFGYIGDMNRFAMAIVDAICPNWCELCGVGLAGGDCLCSDCMIALRGATGQDYCSRCGESLPPFGAADPCSNCPPHTPAYDRVIRVAKYDGAWRLLIQRLKFGRQRRLLSLMSAQLAGAIQRSDIYESIDAIAWTPTCWQHRAIRPFHAAEHLAMQTARRCNIPAAPLLGRKYGPHQTGKSATARVNNVHGKFYLLRGCRLFGARICLIDDVLTTGATAGQCARTLKNSGAAAVIVAVLAKTANHPVAIATA